MGRELSRPAAIFVDDGGVMNNNELRGHQWQRLVAEYLAPRLGGELDAWGPANKTVADRQFAKALDGTLFPSDRGYVDVWDDEEKRWLREMCELVGVDAPASDEACLALARDTAAYVTRRVRSSFPGVAEALRFLHSQGYVLHTASGEVSQELDGYLTGMGVRHLFDRLYGPDIVDTFKSSRAYYDRIFADSGVLPSDALVVDDSPKAVGWARDAGATAVLVSRQPADGGEASPVIGSLSELPGFLEGR